MAGSLHGADVNRSLATVQLVGTAAIAQVRRTSERPCLMLSYTSDAASEVRMSDTKSLLHPRHSLTHPVQCFHNGATLLYDTECYVMLTHSPGAPVS